MPKPSRPCIRPASRLCTLVLLSALAALTGACKSETGISPARYKQAQTCCQSCNAKLAAHKAQTRATPPRKTTPKPPTPRMDKVAQSPAWIKDKPVPFGAKRIRWTLEYIHIHIDPRATSIRIKPKIVVIHFTAIPTLRRSWKAFAPAKIGGHRGYIKRFGRVNVSAHFLVDRDGTVYRMMPETWMGRHVIGLNTISIGIENVGNNTTHPLTDAQLKANARLVRYLKQKYKIQYLIGHHEYQTFRNSPLYQERIKSYRTVKQDPGKPFMKRLRHLVKDLNLRAKP